MNERIRELALEVFSFKYKSNPNELNPDHNMDHIYKFAELIVRECADMAESFQHHQYDFTGDLELHEFIKEHFGINK